MKTKEVAIAEKTEQKIQLIRGEFTSSEAYDIIIALLDEKINFHKIQRLHLWEGDHTCDTYHLDGRIKELLEEKQAAKDFIEKTKGSGHKLEINGVLQITLAD